MPETNKTTKVVNVRATVPVRNVNPPIYGELNGITMTFSDILKCLCKRAMVHEVLPDGTLIRLTTKNFRDDHSNMVVKKVTNTDDPKANSKKPEKPQKKQEKKEPDPVSDDDGFIPTQGDTEEGAMEERTYTDGSTHLVIAGSMPEFTGDAGDEDDAMEPSDAESKKGVPSNTHPNDQQDSQPNDGDKNDEPETPDVHVTDEAPDTTEVTKKETTTKAKASKSGKKSGKKNSKKDSKNEK